jgi:phospholipase/carboxylesterase
MHIKQVIQSGKQTGEATKALVMVHGRGGSAEDILSLANYLPVNDFALFAPQATNNTWYPYSFLVDPKENEPWLSGALAVLKEVVADVQATGITSDNIYFLGFSQGACLTLEFVARNATRYGGVVAFTGGLIGDKIYEQNYTGDFAGTPVFIGTSDPDPHVPVERVHASAEILNGMHAQVTKKIYKNMGHTISQEEINEVKALIFKES